MLTANNNYKIPAVTIQGLILCQMRMAAIDTREWYKAMNNGDGTREYILCEAKNYRQAEIKPLLEVQGITRDTKEFDMVMDYIIDMISYMA